MFIVCVGDVIVFTFLYIRLRVCLSTFFISADDCLHTCIQSHLFQFIIYIHTHTHTHNANIVSPRNRYISDKFCVFVLFNSESIRFKLNKLNCQSTTNNNNNSHTHNYICKNHSHHNLQNYDEGRDYYDGHSHNNDHSK